MKKLFIPLAMIVGLTIPTVGCISEAEQVAREEFGPRALLKKYERFKDMSAQLDAKQADIPVYETRMKSLVEGYGDKPRSEWARDDRQQYSVWESELAGLKASYNGLAAQYNADMAKANYAFTNVGDLPQGAEKPLPREYKPYVTN